MNLLTLLLLSFTGALVFVEGSAEVKTKRILLDAVHHLSPLPASWTMDNSLGNWSGVIETNSSLSGVTYAVAFGPTAPETLGYFSTGFLQWGVSSSSPQGGEESTNSVPLTSPTISLLDEELHQSLQNLPVTSLSFHGINSIAMNPSIAFPISTVVPRFNFTLDSCSRFVFAGGAPLGYLRFPTTTTFQTLKVMDCPIGGTIMLDLLNTFSGGDDGQMDGSGRSELKELVMRNLSFTGALFIPSGLDHVKMDLRENNFGSLLSAPGVVSKLGPNLKLETTNPNMERVEVGELNVRQISAISSGTSLCTSVIDEVPNGKLLDTMAMLKIDDILGSMGRKRFILSSSIQTCYSASSSIANMYWPAGDGVVVFSTGAATIFDSCLFISPADQAVMSNITADDVPSPLTSSSFSDMFLGQYMTLNSGTRFTITLVASPKSRSITFSSESCGWPMGEGRFSLANSSRQELVTIVSGRENITVTRYSTKLAEPKVCHWPFPLYVAHQNASSIQNESPWDQNNLKVSNARLALLNGIDCLPQEFPSRHTDAVYSTRELLQAGDLSIRVLTVGGGSYFSHAEFSLGLVYSPTEEILAIAGGDHTKWGLHDKPQNKGRGARYTAYVGPYQITLIVYNNRTAMEVWGESSKSVCTDHNLLLFSTIPERIDATVSVFPFSRPNTLEDSFKSCLELVTDRTLRLEGVICDHRASMNGGFLDPETRRRHWEQSCIDGTEILNLTETLHSTNHTSTVIMKAEVESVEQIPPDTLCGSVGGSTRVDVELQVMENTLYVQSSNFSFGYWIRDSCSVTGVMWYGSQTSTVHPGALRYPPDCFPADVSHGTMLTYPLQGGTYRDGVLTLTDSRGVQIRFSRASCGTLRSANATQCPLNLEVDSVSVARYVSAVAAFNPADETNEAESPNQENSEYYSTSVVQNQESLIHQKKAPLAAPGQCVPWSDSLIPPLLQRIDGNRLDPVACYRTLGSVSITARARAENEACVLEIWNCSLVAEIVATTASCLLFSNGDPLKMMEYPKLPPGFSSTAPFFPKNFSSKLVSQTCSDGVPGARRLEHALEFAATPISDLHVAIQCLDKSDRRAAVMVACTNTVKSALNTTNSDRSVNSAAVSLYSPIVLGGNVAEAFAPQCSVCLPYTSPFTYPITFASLVVASTFTALLTLFARLFDPKVAPLLVRLRLFCLDLIIPSTVEQRKQNRDFLLREGQPRLKSPQDVITHCAEVADLIVEVCKERGEEEPAPGTQSNINYLGSRIFNRTLKNCCSLTAKFFPYEALWKAAHKQAQKSSATTIIDGGRREKNALLESLIDLRKKCHEMAKTHIMASEGDPLLRRQKSAGLAYFEDDTEMVLRDTNARNSKAARGGDGLAQPLVQTPQFIEDTPNAIDGVDTDYTLGSSSPRDASSSAAATTKDTFIDVDERRVHEAEYDYHEQKAKDENTAIPIATTISEGHSREKVFADTMSLVQAYCPETFHPIDSWSRMILIPAGWYVDLQIIGLYAQFVVALYASDAFNPPVTFAKYQDLYFRVINSPSVGPLMANLYFMRWREFTLIEALTEEKQTIFRWFRRGIAVVFTPRFFLATFLLMPPFFSNILPGAIIFWPVPVVLFLIGQILSAIRKRLPPVQWKTLEKVFHRDCYKELMVKLGEDPDTIGTLVSNASMASPRGGDKKDDSKRRLAEKEEKKAIEKERKEMKRKIEEMEDRGVSLEEVKEEGKNVTFVSGKKLDEHGGGKTLGDCLFCGKSKSQVKSTDDHYLFRNRDFYHAPERAVKHKKPVNMLRVIYCVVERGLKVLMITLAVQVCFNYFLLYIPAYQQQFHWFTSSTPSTTMIHDEVGYSTVSPKFSETYFPFRYLEVMAADFYRRKNACLLEVLEDGYAPNIVQQFATSIITG